MAITTDIGYKAALCCVLAITAYTWANVGTVSAELSGDGTVFTATFSDHANETNSLWVVYGDSDCGLGTNGWAYAERFGTVKKITVIEGATSGAFTSVSGLPTGWEVYVSANKVQVRKNDGFTVIVR